jgi:hypothetical protein
MDSAESVQSYIDRLKGQLPDDESKTQVDTLIPPAAVEMLLFRGHTRDGQVGYCHRQVGDHDHI